MALPATVALADVLDAIRDPNATACSTVDPPTTSSGIDFAYLMLSVAQYFVNLAERLVVSKAYLQLNPLTALYDLGATLTDYCGKTVACTVEGVGEVDGPVDYRALGRASRTWLADLAPTTLLQPLAWAPIGRTLLAFVPVFRQWTIPVPVNPPTVAIRYVQRTPFLLQSQQNTTTLSVPDYASEHVVRLAELLLLIKTRQLTNFEAKLKSLAQEMQLADKFADVGGRAD